MTQWGDDANTESNDPAKPEQPRAADPAAPPPIDPWARPVPPESESAPPAQPAGSPQWGSPPAGQDPWAQPGQGNPATSPQYGQPTQYGQPQYGQPQYGQPQYGQPQYGQPQYGQGGFPSAPAYGVAPASGGPAPLGPRLGAYVIDCIIAFIASAIIGGILAVAGAAQGFNIAADLVIGFGYFGYLNGVLQQTIGKRVVGLKVVDVNTGGPIGFWRACLRYLVLGLTGLICLLGYFSPFFDGTKRNQGWHDKASSALVVTTSR
jgi:uncharacterized RDD family membrane protein YckC